MVSNDVLTGVFGFLFTVFVLSYIVGDSPLFRLAAHAFVGAAAGYVAVMVLRLVIANKLVQPLTGGNYFGPYFLIIPAVLCFLLMTKLSSSLEWIGRPVVAFLVGVGSAAAVAGAMLGTLFPQVEASANMFDLSSVSGGLSTASMFLAGTIVLIGTVVTLAYFQFTTRGTPTPGKRNPVIAFFATLGQVFIAITLGAILAGVLAAALTAFVDRVQFIVLFFDSLFQ